MKKICDKIEEKNWKPGKSRSELNKAHIVRLINHKREVNTYVGSVEESLASWLSTTAR